VVNEIFSFFIFYFFYEWICITNKTKRIQDTPAEKPGRTVDANKPPYKPKSNKFQHRRQMNHQLTVILQKQSQLQNIQISNNSSQQQQSVKPTLL